MKCQFDQVRALNWIRLDCRKTKLDVMVIELMGLFVVFGKQEWYREENQKVEGNKDMMRKERGRRKRKKREKENTREGRQRLRRRREDVRGREGNTAREIEEQNLCWIFTSELFVQLVSYTSLNKPRIISNSVEWQNINTSLHVTPVITKP